MNRHRFSKYLGAAFIGLLAAGASFADTRATVTSDHSPQDILFVGNSFTFYNNGLHNHLSKMMRAGGLETGRLRSMTISGAKLEEHLMAMPGILASNDWDIVILQGHSLAAIDEDRVPGFRESVRKHVRVIRDSGAAPVLFMTWARSHIPEQIEPLNEIYSGIGGETDAVVVPVGLAFDRSIRQENGIVLRMADRRHPTLAGSYLAACTFYAAFFDKSPVGNEYTAGLDASVARTLQTIAMETVDEYYGRARDETGP